MNLDIEREIISFLNLPNKILVTKILCLCWIC